MIRNFFSSLSILVTTLFISCSNSECENSAETYSVSVDVQECSHNKKNNAVTQEVEYVSLDDSEYPYAGLPRIVIETEEHRKINDVVSKIPAKMQIWGEKKTVSSIMELDIRGRGNTSWHNMPKKSYKLEFADKQTVLGMPENRDWALISNFADKSLMKNYLMYHLSAKVGAFYSPRCEFTELFLNGEYLGVYLLTETIKIGKNRINIPKKSNSFIVEFDAKLRNDEQAIYSYIIEPKGKIFHIHDPKNASNQDISSLSEHISSFETFLLGIKGHADNDVKQWIDIDECVKHYWIQEFSKNPDAIFYSSVFFHWVKGGEIKMGPVWDFDLAFGGHATDEYNLTKKWLVRNYYWNKYLFKDSVITAATKQFWVDNKDIFYGVFNTIDSVAEFLHPAANNNFKKWNVMQSTDYPYYRYSYKTYDDAVEDLRKWIHERITWIDEQIVGSD